MMRALNYSTIIRCLRMRVKTNVTVGSRLVHVCKKPLCNIIGFCMARVLKNVLVIEKGLIMRVPLNLDIR